MEYDKSHGKDIPVTPDPDWTSLIILNPEPWEDWKHNRDLPNSGSCRASHFPFFRFPAISCIVNGSGTIMPILESSVIVSTYEEPEHLGMVLLALARQSLAPTEVLVADDGSSESTAAALRDLARFLPFRLTHVRQPHDRFRLARSRNNAVHAARFDRIVFLDQDTLPHRDWLARQLAPLGPGVVCTGYVLRLSEENSRRLSRDAVRAGDFEKWHESGEFAHLDKLQRKFEFYVRMRRLGLGIKGRPAIAFGNAAAWRPDLVAVNGFDEEYVGWGQEDDDLGLRLFMAGVRPVALVNSALVSHIHHPPRRSDDWEAGSNIERYRRRRLSPRCGKGLADHPLPDVTVKILNG